MTTAQDVLTRHFPGLSPDEVDAELSQTPVAGATPISVGALGFLAEHGGEEAKVAIEQYDEAEVQRNRVVAAAQALEELLKSSWSLELVAQKLGISRSRVSHRIGAQTLYAVTLQGRRYVPHWQFVSTPTGSFDGDGTAQPIPGLARIVPLIPRDLHPLAVRSFMETPDEALGGQSPATFLIAHGPVEAVEELLVGLARW